jgi:4-amino-4-deoxy-L-arabinose transferase-like glycosyltransferase
MPAEQQPFTDRGPLHVPLPAITSGADTGAAQASVTGLRWPFVVLGGCALATLMRVLYSGMPLTSDEGGYGEVARLWSRGAELYSDAWADRPQALFIVFRAALAFGDSVHALRVAAVVAGLTVLVLTALVARKLVGERVAAWVVLLAATAGASPFIQAYTLSGELVASVLAVASFGTFLFYLEKRQPWLLVVAGLLTGCALLVKQSAFDASLACGTYLLWTERGWRGVRGALLLATASLVPIAAAAASAPDPGAWWHAVVTYRFEGDSLLTTTVAYRLSLLGFGLWAALLALTVPLVLLGGGWRLAPRLLKLWLVAALLGAAAGGNFWAHYWIQIVPPLCIIAGLRLEQLARTARVRKVPLPVVAAAVFSAVAALGPLLAAPQDRARLVTPLDAPRANDAEVAAYVRAHSAPGTPILVVPPVAADINFLADRPPAFRYMWGRPTQSIPGALEELRAVVASRRAPLAVIPADPDVLDRTGELGYLIDTGYTTVATFGDTRIAIHRR